MTFTRNQIDAIAVGKTLVAHGIDRRFGEATAVVEIFAKGEDIHGKLFVCGYREYGDNARISFSVKEGDESDARHYIILQIPDDDAEYDEGRYTTDMYDETVTHAHTARSARGY